MTNPVRIHTGKEPIRVHFIPEWAAKRDMTQADICRELGVDKATVSRWFKEGNIPSSKYLEPLAEAFGLEDVNGLFLHPDDDWLARFFRGKSEEQKTRAMELLNLWFKETGT